MIITGAPVETLDFEALTTGPSSLKSWTGALPTFTACSMCWGAQAALYHHYGVPKHNLSEKCFGVFENRPIKPSSSGARF